LSHADPAGIVLGAVAPKKLLVGGEASIAIDALDALLQGRDGLSGVTGGGAGAAAPPSPAMKGSASGGATGRVSGSATGATSPSGDGSVSPRPGSNSAASASAAGAGGNASAHTLCPVPASAITPLVRLTVGPLTATLPGRLEGSAVVVSLTPPPGTSPDAFPSGDVVTEVSLDGGASYGPTAGVLKIAKK
jgi:hypothetical protein